MRHHVAGEQAQAFGQMRRKWINSSAEYGEGKCNRTLAAEANRICVAWMAGDSSSAGVSRMPARHRRASAIRLSDRLAYPQIKHAE